jgi:formylglycine-generating enzyme required for sulfatase activity
VEGVSWYDAIVFCNKLSLQEGLSPAYRINNSTNPADWGPVPRGGPFTGDPIWDAAQIVADSSGYRLPTEAQWEYACRAGTTTAYNSGDTISGDDAWYDVNTGPDRHVRETGLKPANAWDLYDMHGNVSEWCWDWIGEYGSEPQIDPTGAASGDGRVRRGGATGVDRGFLRSASRNYDSPGDRGNYIGFRVIRMSN